jgi:dihydrofolate reductase
MKKTELILAENNLNKPIISHIVNVSENLVIGRDNDLLWRLPEDLKRFKEITMGHPMIMGRKTYESIGRPLPGRTSIVVTHNKDLKIDGVIVVHTIEEALEKAKEIEKEEVFIIGGGQIFNETFNITDKIYLTLVHIEAEGNVYYPKYKDIFIRTVYEEDNEENGLRYTWLDLVKE